MKTPFHYLCLILLFLACTRPEQNTADQMEPLFPAPKIIPLNTEDGYSKNQLTGNDTKPLVNRLGDTLVTGKPIPVIGRRISIDTLPKPKVIPVVDPIVSPGYDNSIKSVSQPAVIPVNLDTLPFFEPTAKTDSFVLVNRTNDTISTGIPIPVKGKMAPCIYPKPIEALSPRFKDGAVETMRYLTTDQGLGVPSVSSLLEDKRGNLWIGAGDLGVIKYDGRYFLNFTEAQGITPNAIGAILEDRQGNLWFGGGQGVCKYNGENLTYFTEKEGLARNAVNCILEDKQGNIWIGTGGGGLCKYDGENLTHFSLKEGLPCMYVTAALEDKQGNLWFGTSCEGIIKYDGKNFTQIKTKNGLVHNGIFALLEDNQGNIWVGTHQGVSKYDGTCFTNYSLEKDGAFQVAVKSMLEDRHGNLWFGTMSGGVTKFDGKHFYRYGDLEGLSGSVIACILEDKAGNLLFGTRDGGVTIYDPGKFTRYNIALIDADAVFSVGEDETENIWFGAFNGIRKLDGKNWTNYNIVDRCPAICKDRTGNLWLAGQGIGLTKFDGTEFMSVVIDKALADFSVHDILEDNTGNIWFSIQKTGEVVKFDKKGFTFYGRDAEGKPQFISAVLEIYEDREGNFWFGSNGGISKFDGEHLIHYTVKEGLSHNRVLSILQDSSGNIWFGTYGGGVNKFDGKSFTLYTEKEGLASNLVLSIVMDKNGYVWAATKKGLSCLKVDEPTGNPSNMRIFNFAMEDGLLGSNFIQNNNVVIDSQNRAWWGTGKGFSILDFNTFYLPDQPPKVKLNHIEIDEQFIDFRNLPDSSDLGPTFNGVAKFANYPLNLQLPFEHNHLTFHFTATDWYAPHKIKYSYKMEGLDDQWSPPATKTSVDYRNMPHGSFTFKVRAIGASLEWSEAFEYSFTIQPPWWGTWWAISAYALLGLGLVFGYARWRTHSLKRQKAVLEQTIKERTIELQEQKERAERSERYKEQFLANMSHEIRTPMHAISGMTNILLRNKHPEHQDKFLKAIQKNSENLLVILNDILDLSKIEAGKIAIEQIPMSLSRVVVNVVEVLRLKADEKDLMLQASVAEGIPDQVKGDPTRLTQILLNLVGNAIKFTEHGKVELSVTEANGMLRFSVQDTGIGIPAEKLDHIFGSFEQADLSTTREYGGTGLGLSISKQLVELQNGKIWVESQEGVGSTFSFDLPLILVGAEDKPEEQISEEQLAAMADSLSGLRILLAEDNPFNVMVATDDLAYYIPKVKITVAENGKEAVREFENGVYDIVLMDMHMPEMNGYDASKTIRAMEASTDSENAVPIIAMTASLLKSELDTCFEAGMDNYIPKPYKMHQLIGTIYKEANKNAHPS